ncbi:MAG: hypothetical protein LW832_01815 [Parachlamydia sp.]|nr:hypothetical protein [Parachlamydia sp.]
MSWDAKDADEKFKDLSARGINTSDRNSQKQCRVVFCFFLPVSNPGLFFLCSF